MENKVLNFTLDQQQAEMIAKRINICVMPAYQIPLDNGFTIPRLVDFLPDDAEESLSLYDYFLINLDHQITITGMNHSIMVESDGVTVEWV